jgi:hypothetical protein
MTRRPHRLRGFTLAEMATALAVSLVVVYAAVMSVMAIQRSIATSRHSSSVAADASLIADHIARHIQAAGGSGVPIEAAFVLEEAGCGPRHGLPDCGPNDRLTLVIPLEKCSVPAECAQIPLTNLVGSTLYGPLTCGTSQCCMSTNPDGIGMLNENRKMYIFGADGSRQIAIMGVVNTSVCTAGFTSVGASYPTEFQSGTLTDPGADPRYMVPVRTVTFFVDSSDRLLAYWDHDHNGLRGDQDVEVVAVDVKSLHFAVGYDVNGDGVVDDDGTDADEWLGNAPGEAIGAGGLSTANATMARMVTVGLVTGQSAPHLSTDRSAAVLNGVPVSEPRTVYGVAHATVMFRNLDIFN